jgi:hypothetical protein
VLRESALSGGGEKEEVEAWQKELEGTMKGRIMERRKKRYEISLAERKERMEFEGKVCA